MLAEVSVVELRHGLAYQKIKGGLCEQSVYDGGIWRADFFFLSACESRALTGNHSGGGCV